MHRISIWLPIAALAALGACSDTYGPKDSTQTGNPPILDDGRVSLEVSAGEVRITGKPASVAPAGATIEITNLTTGMLISGMAAADGSFAIRVDGSVNDTFAVRVLAGDEESKVVYVVRGGALVAEGGDGSLSCSEYSELARAVLRGSAAAADRSCSSDLDCAVVPLPSCHPGCDAAYVSNAGVSQVEATLAAVRNGLCADAKQDGCNSGPPPCSGFRPASCVAGQCNFAGEATSCEARAQLAEAVIAEALAAADTSCESDSDCATAGTVSACTEACSEHVVSRAGKATIEAAVAEVEGGVCAAFEVDGCYVERQPCVPPQPAVPRCDAGQCKLVPAPINEDPPSCVSCFTETLRWGRRGGLVYYEDQSELAPCAHYTHERQQPGGSGDVTLMCERDLVACNSIGSTGAVMNALGHPDVQGALAASPIVYGIDGRGVDGTVFEIVQGSRVIVVGGPCRDTVPGCVPTPPGVQALVDLLQAIDQAMLMSDECAAFVP
jgi:hypothetical protein